MGKDIYEEREDDWVEGKHTRRAVQRWEEKGGKGKTNKPRMQGGKGWEEDTERAGMEMIGEGGRKR